MNLLLIFSSIPLVFNAVESHVDPKKDCYSYVISEWTKGIADVGGLGSFGLYHYCVAQTHQECSEFKKLVEKTDVTDVDIFMKKLMLDVAALSSKGIVKDFKPEASPLDHRKEIEPSSVPRFIVCFKADEEFFARFAEYLKRTVKEKYGLSGVNNFHVYYVDKDSEVARHHLVQDGIVGAKGEMVKTREIPLDEFFNTPHVDYLIGGKKTAIFSIGECHEIKLVPANSVKEIREFQQQQQSKKSSVRSEDL